MIGTTRKIPEIVRFGRFFEYTIGRVKKIFSTTNTIPDMFFKIG
jgi:hypothetical protein